MEDKVTVTVKGNLVPDMAGDREAIEIVCAGERYMRGGSRFVLYEEVMPGFDENVRNVLRIADDFVTLRKRGLVVADLAFREGELCSTHYVTPFGSIMLGMSTRSLRVTDKGDSTDISIVYDAELNYERTGECRIDIRIEPAGAEEQTAQAPA